MRSAKNLKIGIEIDEATFVTRRRIKEITTHMKQGLMKQDGSHTTILQTVISQDIKKRIATIMQESPQTLTLRLIDSRVISLISQQDKRVHHHQHHQLTGWWIKMIKSTL